MTAKQRMKELTEDNKTQYEIARILNEEGLKTLRGKNWTSTSVCRWSRRWKITGKRKRKTRGRRTQQPVVSNRIKSKAKDKIDLIELFLASGIGTPEEKLSHIKVLVNL